MLRPTKKPLISSCVYACSCFGALPLRKLTTSLGGSLLCKTKNLGIRNFQQIEGSTSTPTVAPERNPKKHSWLL